MSKTSLTSKCGLFAFVAVFLLASFPCRAPAAEYRSPSDGIESMTYEDGRLSLEAKDASLDKVLSELARIAMLTIVADGPIEGRITLYADRLPLEKALRKILRGKDTSFVYTAKAETSPTEYEIMEVRIYLAKAGKGEARRYSYSRQREEEQGLPRPPPSRSERSRSRGLLPRAPAGSPQMPPVSSPDEAQRLLSELMEGNLDGLNEIAEKLKQKSPEVEEQIDAFLQSLEDMRTGAGEGGLAVPELEGMGNMQDLMKQILDKGSMSPGQKRE